jgi:uncharacterized protein (TIGR03435 family)
MRLNFLALAILLLAPFMNSQELGRGNPAYDVSAVRPSSSFSEGHSDLDIDAGTLVARGVNLRTLIQIGFDVPRDLIFNLPAWVSGARFDIDAKDSSTEPEQLKHLSDAQTRLMLQGLLAERFGLKSHTEMRELAAFELVFVRRSPALRRVDKAGEGTSIHNSQLQGKGIPISGLIKTFSNELHRPVVDHTGLKGFYDVDLRWRSDDEASNIAAEIDPGAPPVLLTAVQEQLGLKLRSGKQMVPVLVIDRLTPPTGN